MLKLKKKKLIFCAILCSLLLFISFLNPYLRVPLLNNLELPFKLLALIQREFAGIIFYHRNLIQNERFKKEIDLLKNKLNIQQELRLENARLKGLLSFKEKSPFKLIASRVIGRSPDTWSSSIIIDKGRHSGIQRDMAVITYLGLVGRIIEVQESTSKILLINDPGFGISTIVQRSRQEGLVSGTLGAHLIMKYLPEGADINIGDIIITSGLNDAYPKGLLIGSVIEVAKELSGLSYFAIIKPAVNLSNIEEVLVIIQ